MTHYLKRVFVWGVAALALLVSAVHVQAQTFPTNLVGSYQADLIAGQTIYGRLTATVSASGKATGSLQMPNGKSYSFSTGLTVDGGTAFRNGLVLVRGPLPLPGPQNLTLISFRVYPDGSVTAGTFSMITGIPATLTAANGIRLATYTGKTGSIAPWVGAYTMAITPDDEAAEGTPAGAGYATITVTPNGKLSFKGKLGDGTKLTGSAQPDLEGIYSLFTSVYGPGGMFTAKLDLDALGQQEEQGYWNKPANLKDSKYKAGFAAAVDVQVREWIKLTSVKIPTGFASSKNFAVDFSGEGLSDADFATTLPDTARFTGTGAVQAVAGGASAPAENDSKEWNKLWSVKVNPATGEFTGTQVLKSMVGTKVVSKKIPVAGVILAPETVNDLPFALGQYSVTPSGGTEVSGLVSFSGPLEDNTTVATVGNYNLTIEHIAVSDSTKPSNPEVLSGAVANGGTVKFTLSEDLQTMDFGGKKLKLKGGIHPVAIEFTNATPTNTMNTLTVIVYRNFAGEISGVSGIYTKATVKGVSVRFQTVTFQNKSPLATNLVRL